MYFSTDTFQFLQFFLFSFSSGLKNMIKYLDSRANPHRDYVFVCTSSAFIILCYIPRQLHSKSFAESAISCGQSGI